MKELLKKVWAWLKRVWDWVVAIPKDKLLHDYAGALITLFAFALVHIFAGFWASFLAANITALVILVGKEVYDRLHPESQTAECEDVLWGLFGAFKVDLALLILLISI